MEVIVGLLILVGQSPIINEGLPIYFKVRKEEKYIGRKRTVRKYETKIYIMNYSIQ